MNFSNIAPNGSHVLLCTLEIMFCRLGLSYNKHIPKQNFKILFGSSLKLSCKNEFFPSSLGCLSAKKIHIDY